MLVQQLVNGLTLGCIYGLNALGFSMIFGVIRLINFAQMDMAMIGGFCALATVGLLQRLGVHDVPVTVAASLLVAVTVAGVLSLVIERIVFRPIRNSPAISGLVASLGVSLVLENSAMLLLGSDVKVLPPVFPDAAVHFCGARITLLQILIPILSALLMFGLFLFVRRTKLGTAMRATAENPGVAQLMGIDPNRVVRLAFLVSGGLGATAGLLMAMYYSVVKYDMGLLPGIKGFSAAILGGLGSMPGGVLGGFIIGLAESLCGGYLSTAYQDVVAFAILIVVLVLRPGGLLGGRDR